MERVLGAHPQLEPFEKSQLGIFMHDFFPMSLSLSLISIFSKQTRSMMKRGADEFVCGARGAASLCCESAEEAKTLIPSLTNKITDGDLQEILDDITKLRTFVD